jgi:hypothetical protein
MTWVALLLADPSPCLRWLVLRHLLHLPEDDPEVRELAELRLSDPRVTDLLVMQQLDGSWGSIKETGIALHRLGYLGFAPDFEPIRRGAEYLFSRQKEDGCWALIDEDDMDGRQPVYSMRPQQTAFPLRGLAGCGYATDVRAERAYEWLLAHRLADGAWHTGLASGVFGYVAGYRRLPHSRWGCRSSTTSALICLALHPQRRYAPETQRALDHLLGRETRERNSLGFDLARLLGAEPVRGFTTFYGRFDLAFLLRISYLVGAQTSDARVADLIDDLRQWQGEYGLWDYQPKPQLSRWLTFDLLCSLQGIESNSSSAIPWVSTEPRTPFQSYPKKIRRF